MEKVPIDFIQRAIADISAGNNRAAIDAITAAIHRLNKLQTRLLIAEVNSIAPDMFNFAVKLFYSTDSAASWFNEPAYGLGWQRPIHILRTDPGRVKAILEQFARSLASQGVINLPGQDRHVDHPHQSGKEL